MLVENAEMSLAKADMYIARRYAGLVQPKTTRDKVFGLIHEEYDRSVRMVLDVCGRSQLLENHPTLAESIRLRNPYVDPLNYLQVHLLPRWRESSDSPPDEELRRVLALSVLGIAFGMKSTG